MVLENGEPRRETIVNEFRGAIAHMFEDIVFAFICGSVARGADSSLSDIDMMIIVPEVKSSEAKQFRDWYFAFHLRHGYAPDRIYPGEFLSLSDLDAGLEIACSSIPVAILENASIWEALVWAGMLSGQICGFTGNWTSFSPFVGRADKICKRWISALGPQLLESQHIDVALTKLTRLGTLRRDS
jgi:hypothetical protein